MSSKSSSQDKGEGATNKARSLVKEAADAVIGHESSTSKASRTGDQKKGRASSKKKVLAMKLLSNRRVRRGAVRLLMSRKVRRGAMKVLTSRRVRRGSVRLAKNPRVRRMVLSQAARRLTRS